MNPFANILGSNSLGQFFSAEAGQARRAWLDEQDARATNAMRSILGPQLSPRVEGVLGAVSALSDGQDYQDAYDASGRLMRSQTIPEAARNALAFAAPAAAVMIPGFSNRLAQGVGDVASDAVRFVGDESGAIGRASSELTPAQAQAQSVLDMLKTGRASEVTDDMLEAADPQYLFNNYDLPMDEASRMARADGMGFDTGTPLYHGTTSRTDYSTINPSQRGKIGPGVYLTPNARLANVFAGADQTSITLREPPLPNARVMPLVATNRPADESARFAARSVRGDYEGNNLQAYRDVFDAHGFDGVSVEDERTILNPANIRSRFARFDPRLKHLSNLSAGVGAVGLANIMQQQREEARKQQILRGLGL